MAGETQAARKINVNRAGRDELMEIDGIGHESADLIIRYRMSLGQFHNVEDLRSVPGLDLSRFDQFKGYLTV